MEYVANSCISIIIPVFNGELYLDDVIGSLLVQTLQPLEVIIVDDGSTDATRDIVTSYQQQFPHIVYISQAPTGSPATGRNKGIAIARGKYLLFVDADDVLPVNACELLYSPAEKYQCDIVLGNRLEFAGSVKDLAVRSPSSCEGECEVTTLEKNLDLFRKFGASGKLFRTDFIRRVGALFVEGVRYGEDQPFTLKSYCQAERIGIIEHTIYYYRILETSSSRDISEQTIEESLHISNMLFSILEEASLGDLLEELIQKRIRWDIFRLMLSCPRLSKKNFLKIKKHINPFRIKVTRPRTHKVLYGLISLGNYRLCLWYIRSVLVINRIFRSMGNRLT